MTLRALPRPCVCGHPADTHLHYRPGRDCGVCGPGVCPGYDPVDLDQMCADHAVIDAVNADDLDRALDLAPVGTVALLVALRDDLRAAS